MILTENLFFAKASSRCVFSNFALTAMSNTVSSPWCIGYLSGMYATHLKTLQYIRNDAMLINPR